MNPAFDPFNRLCPSRTVLDTIADRWAVLTLVALGEGRARFGALRERVDGISPKMLTATLRALEADGLAARIPVAGGVRHVDYELTALGRSAVPAADALVTWARGHTAAVLDARKEIS
ncbi:helix-turn-helix domain-containing protein [Propioniciclava sp.]|uniref:winged helix-turn-helix transcriptional regulator n=1 Tax=Propioniciclava sp. TaxID=2038686 RepID=UPI002601BFCA|nr:helix-turn-helix domain-containing protein [Propioniciclava sp.]